MLSVYQKNKIKNLRTISLNVIDKFQKEEKSLNILNDPRGLMSDVDVTCSLLRKQVRENFINWEICPKSTRNDNFFKMIKILEKIMNKKNEILKRN